MTDEDGARLVAEASARMSDRVIDYEHATLLQAKAGGGKAPAAGWFRALEWRPGDGLWALGVQWTALAAKHLADREYRYLSPVFSFDKESGRVLQLLHASLTNDPGLDGLTDLAALAADLLLPPTRKQEQSMNELLKKLLASLGLQETATEAEALSAVAALKTNVAALSAQVGSPDPAKYVPIAALSGLQAEHADVKGKLATLTTEISAGKVTALVADGVTAGKITPATEAWAKSLGLKQTLLADMHRNVCKAYGFYWADLNIAARGTVLIGKDGKVQWVQKREVPQAMKSEDLLAALAM